VRNDRNHLDVSRSESAIALAKWSLRDRGHVYRDAGPQEDAIRALGAQAYRYRALAITLGVAQ
jgi:hypothetical protein